MDEKYNITNNFTTEDPQYELEDNSKPVIPMSQVLEYRIAMGLVLWCLPVIILLGTVGNLLSFIVLMRMRACCTSVYFYLATLACADTAVLFVSGFKTWIRVLTGFELLHVSYAGCKIIMFLFLCSLHMSAWLVVALTFDRFIATWFPLKAATLCTIKRARIITIGGAMILLIYNSHVFWTMELKEIKGHRYCTMSTMDYFSTVIFPWLKLATYSLVPFGLVLVLNICIISKILASGAMTKDALLSRTSTNQTQRVYNRVTVMLMTVSITWLVFTAPFVLWQFVMKREETTQGKAKNLLMKIVCFLLMYLNHAINFYLYCQTGKKFRKALKELGICCNKNALAMRRVSSVRTSQTILRKQSNCIRQGMEMVRRNGDPV